MLSLLILSLAAGYAAAHLQLDFGIHHGSDPSNLTPGRPPLEKRGTFEIGANLTQKAYYLSNITLGSNNQTILVQLDTGSVDLWVASPNNTLCPLSPLVDYNNPDADATWASCQWTTFDSTTLTTFRNNGTAFEASYGSGQPSIGYWAYDTLTFGGVVIPDFFFGYANLTSMPTTVFGLGLRGGETNYLAKGVSAFTYPPVIDRLVESGAIAGPLFLVWLNGDQPTGSYLFGGIDYAKFTGLLNVVPFTPDSFSDNAVTDPIVLLNGILIDDGENLQAVPMGVVFDTGSQYTYIPGVALERIGKQFNLTFNDNDGNYYGLCDNGPTGNLTFQFDGFNFSVPFDILWEEVGQDSAGDEVCALRLCGTQGMGTIGDNVLPQMYVVYDYGNLLLGVATAVADTEKSDIKTASDLNVASATYVASQSQTYSPQTVANVPEFTFDPAARLASVSQLFLNGVTEYGNYGSVSELETISLNTEVYGTPAPSSATGAESSGTADASDSATGTALATSGAESASVKASGAASTLAKASGSVSTTAKASALGSATTSTAKGSAAHILPGVSLVALFVALVF